MKVIPEKRRAYYSRYTRFIKTQNIKAKIKKVTQFFILFRNQDLYK